MEFTITVSYKENPFAKDGEKDFEHTLKTKFDDESAKVVAELLATIDAKIQELKGK